MMESSRPRRFSRWSVPLIVGCLVFTADVASASGGYGGGGGFSGRENQADRGPKSDPTYDLGKKVYSGRSQSARGMRVCLAPADDAVEGSEPLRISRKALKPFKQGTRTELATRLVDCAAGSAPARSKLSAGEIHALIHYLDRRFRLKLES